MNDVSSRVDRGGEGSQIERTSLRPFHVISVPSTGVLTARKAKKTFVLGSKQRMCARNVFFRSGTQFSHSVYSGRHCRHSHDKMDQALPLVFAYCKRSKTGRREGLGMRLLFILAHLNCEHLLSLNPLTTDDVFWRCQILAASWRNPF